VLRFYNGLRVGSLAPNQQLATVLQLDPGEEQTIRIPVTIAADAIVGNHTIALLYLTELGIAAAFTGTHLS
jgi:hypothetical protein